MNFIKQLALSALLLAAATSPTHARTVAYATHPSFDVPGLSKAEEDAEFRDWFEGIAEANCGIDLVRVPWGQQRVSIYSADLIYQINGKWFVDLGRSDASKLSIWLHNGTRNGGRRDYYLVHPDGTSSRGLMGTTALHEFGHLLPEYNPNASNHHGDGWGHLADSRCIMSIQAVSRAMCPAEVAVFRRHYGPPTVKPTEPPKYPAGTFLLAAAGANVRFGDGTGIGLVGRWKDGKWGLGTYNPATSVFSGRFSLTSGPPEFAFQFGSPGLGLQPVIADYDFDGSDNVGVYNPTTGRFLFRKTLTPGKADYDVTYGPVGGAMAVNGLGVGVYVKQQK